MKKNNKLIQKINSKILELEILKSSKEKHWNISLNLGNYLSDIVLKKNPQKILEIGTSNGFSTLFITKSINKNSKITTIEVNEKRFLEAKKNFKDCEIENIIQIEGEIFDLIENKKISDKFDFIFLDAAQRMYLDLIKKLEKFNLLSNNFILVADNVLSHNNMDNFLNYMKNNYSTKIIHKDTGFLIATKKN